MTSAGISLAGRRVLLVEDNFHIAEGIALALKQHGAEIIGPAGSVKRALALVADAERIDGATLDINLHGEMVYPVIDALRAKAVPIVIMTGYDAVSVEAGYAGVPCLQKPVNIEHLMQALFG